MHPGRSGQKDGEQQNGRRQKKRGYPAGKPEKSPVNGMEMKKVICRLHLKSQKNLKFLLQLKKIFDQKAFF